MPEKCHVVNCTAPVVAKGLCNTHYKRMLRQGTVEQTRPADWGKREAHPAYKSWSGLLRYHRHRTDPRWVSDFWTFVSEIPEKPTDDKSTAQRVDDTRDWGPDNFYWRVPRLSKQFRDDRAAYMREYQRQMRAADPDYGRNADLKKNYGVTLEWFKTQFEAQNGVCFICEQPETATIRGKTLNLAVDHCHDTQDVRGLLCSACNRAIGGLKHDKRLLEKAIDYLNRPPLEKF